MGAHRSKYVAGGLLLASLAVVGCDKPPVAEQEAAKAAVGKAQAAEATTYAVPEMSLLADSLRAAEAEVQRQDEKTFPNYDKARASLAWVAANSDDVVAKARKSKEETRAKTRTMVDAADSALVGAERLLAEAPKGKESMQEIELIQGELTQLRTLLAPARQLLGQERFKEAQDSASKIRMDADRVSAEVQGVIDRLAALKTKGGRRR